MKGMRCPTVLLLRGCTALPLLPLPVWLTASPVLLGLKLTQHDTAHAVVLCPRPPNQDPVRCSFQFMVPSS